MSARSGISATSINVVTLSTGEGREETPHATKMKAAFRFLTRNLDTVKIPQHKRVINVADVMYGL
jgi:hypothetical protein